MPWNPAEKHMAKLDEWGKDAQDRFRAASANTSGSGGGSNKLSLSDKLKAAKSGAGMTAIGQRWESEKNARQQQVQSQNQNENSAEHASTPPPPLPPSSAARRQAPAAQPFPARPPPPPQRSTGASSPALPPRSATATRPPLPTRSSATSSSTLDGGRRPPPPPARNSAAPPSLPPRMNNESGTANPPPPYNEDDLNASVDQMSIGSAAPPSQSRRAAPPVPTRPKPGQPQPQSAPAPARPPPSSTPAQSAPTSTIGSLSASRRDPSEGPCKALEAATFFCYPSHYPEWQSTWFYSASSPQNISQPPLLSGRRDFSWQASFSSYGNDFTQIGVVQFDDLSTLWYKITFNSQQPSNFDCKVAYADVPSAWEESSHPGLLLASAQGYGELVARKVEEWQGTSVGDGECWTLAHEALVTVNREQNYSQDLKLFESIGRTHGHLIYRGIPGQGKWRGGDVGNLRRGDILEWEYSKCKTTNGGIATLGNPDNGMPDHTAVIIDVQHNPHVSNMSPSSFKSITVLEQSKGQPVSQNTLDVGQLISGGFWVFRPVGALALLEGKVEPKWHDSEARRGWEALN
ncbi:unnamed protein product [Sympodiomycopsis kandeliae]